MAIESLSHPSQLPSVDKILQSELFTGLTDSYGRDTVLTELRGQLNIVRGQLAQKKQTDQAQVAKNQETEAGQAAVISQLHSEVASLLDNNFTPSLRRVINLTGTILHTNLGRAPYPQSAIDAMVEVSRGACNLEYDLDHGKRGRRDDHVEDWICKLTGAEAATTVNNNAAAVSVKKLQH